MSTSPERNPERIRIQFSGISSRAWEHPADRSALVALRKLAGFDTVLKTLSGLLQERKHRLIYLSSSIRVDARQFADVHDLFTESLRILDVKIVPELFIIQDPVPSAMTIGMDAPFIVLTTGLVDLLDTEELRFVLGHEIGHAQSGHAVYQTMLMHLLRLAGNFGWIPVGGWALRALIAGLYEWSRKAELSGDRAGLLAGQNFDAGIRLQMKLAGGARLSAMNTEAFLDQAAEYNQTGDLRDGVLKLLNLELQSHPFSVLRAAELKKWVDSGEYDEILAGSYPRHADDPHVNLGDEMRNAARTYRSNMKASQDPLVRTVRDVGENFGSAAESVGQGISETVSNIGRRFSQWRQNVEDNVDAEGSGENGPAAAPESDSGSAEVPTDPPPTQDDTPAT